MLVTTFLVALWATAAVCQAQASVRCPLVFDGRIPSTVTNTVFDTASSPFSPENVKGKDLAFSSMVSLPASQASRFEENGTKAVGISINDESIFQPGDPPGQLRFRRAEFLYKANNGTDSSATGFKTVHWSVQLDPSKPLNLSHEYMMVWRERNDFSANQFMFQIGSLLYNTSVPRDNWSVVGKTNNIIFTTPVSKDGWQNFAVSLDQDKK